MSKKTSLLLAVLALALAAPMAHAAPSFSVGVHGGLGLPLGDFSNEDTGLDAKSGFTLGLCLDYNVNEMFSVGLDGSWMQNKHGAEGSTVTIDTGSGTFDLTDTKDKFTTTQFGAHGKYWLPMKDSKLRTYGLLGLGMYSVTEKFTETTSNSTDVLFPDGETSGEDKSDSRFGGKLGIGGEWMASEMVGVSLGADYNFITLDKTKSGGISSLSYVDVELGVHWHIMSK
jgi:opacity protein-like surface antigen